MKPAEVDAELMRTVEQQLILLGEDPTRHPLRKTPERVARALQFLTSGYRQDIKRLVNDAIFEEPNQEMIVVRDIEIYSLCEHHLLPFFGKAHVAYVPDGRIIGLSKIPRIVDAFARRLQVQERLTEQIAAALDEALKPKGVGVIIEARHLCMMMRGVEKQNSSATTSSMLGIFRTDSKTRTEFLELSRGRRGY
jgi:GTP cyclohydrolase I